ncbi:Not CCR4-Not complex component, partial [Cyberlindnera jadinii NRRL Y-1542]
MAHRKLQQEIDKVFKKINEGLDIFNTYHERHENAPNASVKEKLENDLKREVKKLQKLREQIKVWQAQSEVKDKEKLLEYRRAVEVAMEKYKVVEKGSKVKAYSNMSLKAAGELDPEEQEKVDTIQFLQDSIDELE